MYGRLVHLEADAVAEAVEEALGRAPRRPSSCAGSDSPRPRRRRRRLEDRAALDAGADQRGRRSSSAVLGERVPLAHLIRHRPGDDRAGHVGEAGGGIVAGPEVEDDGVAELIGPWPISWPAAPWAPGDDEVLGRQPCSANTRRIAALSRSTVSGSPSSHSTPSPFSASLHERDAGREARLGGALGAPDALELGAGLDPAALVEDRLIDRQLDPVAPQPVEVPGRKRVGNGGAASVRRGQQARAAHSWRPRS